MANRISVQSPLAVQFTFDTDAGAGLAPAPLTILCNRQYTVVDAVFVNPTVTAISGTVQALDVANPVNTVTMCTINAIAAGTITRPTLQGAPGAGFLSLSFAANVAPATSGFDNIVVRGGTLRINMAASGDFATGYLTILPGNRYASGAGTYYPNNATALQA